LKIKNRKCATDAVGKAAGKFSNKFAN